MIRLSDFFYNLLVIIILDCMEYKIYDSTTTGQIIGYVDAISYFH